MLVGSWQEVLVPNKEPRERLRPVPASTAFQGVISKNPLSVRAEDTQLQNGERWLELFSSFQ